MQRQQAAGARDRARYAARLGGVLGPSEELRALFEADQALRGNAVLRRWVLARLLWEDWHRRRRVKRLIAAQAPSAPEDFCYAAMVLQHGLHLDDYWQAHQLARRAAEAGYRPARWLAAAALDRWLLRQGRPQKYGTQYVPAGLPRWAWWVWWTGRFRLWEVDPATTDAERAATIGQPHLATRLGPTIATIELGDLRLEVQDIQAVWATAPASAGAPPQAEPLRPGDTPGPVVIPEGGSLCRVGETFGVADVDGKVIALWRRGRAPPDEPYRYYWRWAHAPRLVEARVDGRVRRSGSRASPTAALSWSRGLTRPRAGMCGVCYRARSCCGWPGVCAHRTNGASSFLDSPQDSYRRRFPVLSDTTPPAQRPGAPRQPQSSGGG